MAKFKKIPVVIEAIQWFKHGDHKNVKKLTDTVWHNDNKLCDHCGEPYSKHGLIPTLESSHIVCPTDWIITGVKGEQYPCKHDIFLMTYEEA